MAFEGKKYIDTKKDNLKIRLSISFNRSQTNWATNEQTEIGYRVTATPVEVIDKGDYKVESFSAFSGFNDTLLACNRRSAKRLEAAIDILDSRIEKYKDFFIKKGIEFA